MLHHGRLHPKETRITQDLFDEIYPGERADVRFSDGTIIQYHPVANIDGPSRGLQDSVATFVGQCNRIRVYYTDGEEEALLVNRVEEAEGSSPESTQPYSISAQQKKIIERKHGKLWQALVAFLDRKNISHTNDRLGRWGPDLRTKNAPLMLFEIKTESKASDIQRGLGQLILYERMLQKSFEKVLLLPTLPPPRILKHLADLDVRVACFKQSKGKFIFAKDVLKSAK